MRVCYPESMDSDSPVRELTHVESNAFLAAHKFGRLAVVLADEPQIIPVNYVAHEVEENSGTIYIRSSQGDKLFAASASHRVAFEVDFVNDDGATSVIAYGTARIVSERDEADLVDTLGLVPWIATHKPNIIAIDVDRVSGRQFVFGPEPDGTHIESPG